MQFWAIGLEFPKIIDNPYQVHAECLLMTIIWDLTTTEPVSKLANPKNRKAEKVKRKEKKTQERARHPNSNDCKL